MDDEGNEVRMLNPNALIEIGAAMTLSAGGSSYLWRRHHPTVQPAGLVRGEVRGHQARLRGGRP